MTTSTAGAISPPNGKKLNMNGTTDIQTTAPLPVEIIEEAKCGDSAAFEELYHLYKRRVYAVCLRLTKNALDAEDLTQEVFLQVYRKGHSFRGEAAFGSWLYRVATNITLMHLRRRRIKVLGPGRFSDLESDAIRVSLQPGAYALFGPAERIALIQALGSLTKGRRIVVVLHDIEGLTHREVAKHLGVTASTSKSQLRHAHRALRDALGGVLVPASNSPHDMMDAGS